MLGDASQLPVGQAAESCQQAATASAIVNASPPLNSVFYLVIRGNNVCGSGGYGLETSGLPRVSGACP